MPWLTSGFIEGAVLGSLVLWALFIFNKQD